MFIPIKTYDSRKNSSFHGYFYNYPSFSATGQYYCYVFHQDFPEKFINIHV